MRLAAVLVVTVVLVVATLVYVRRPPELTGREYRLLLEGDDGLESCA